MATKLFQNLKLVAANFAPKTSLTCISYNEIWWYEKKVGQIQTQLQTRLKTLLQIQLEIQPQSQLQIQVQT